MSAASGYDVNIPELRQEASRLAGIIDDLKEQISNVEKTKNTMLNDSLWHGPNKTKFMSRLEAYEQNANKLLINAAEYHAALTKVIDTYIEAEA